MRTNERVGWLRRGINGAILVMGIALAGCSFSTVSQPPQAVSDFDEGTSLTPAANATDTETPKPIPTFTPTHTSTPTPDYSPTPSLTPTQTPPFRTLADGNFVLYADPPKPPVTPIPPAAVYIPAPPHITTVLLLGSDQREGGRGNATDTIILVAVNRQANAVNMLSIPRDTYVYIPGWTMDRINTAFVRGDVTGYPGGGIALLRETLLYNLGIDVDYYAQVDLNGFRQMVDLVGGVDITVDCALTDWRLISPELDVNDEDNWEEYSMPVGVHHMDGDTALWYARARQSTSDFDRNRRQQHLLRAMWQQSLSLDLIPNAPGLWNQATQVVETDMQFSDALEFAPVAINMDANLIRGRTVAEALSGWTTPDTKASVQLPNLEKLSQLANWLYVEPAVYAVVSESSTIEVQNGTVYDGWDVVAAERLAWEGLSAEAAGKTGPQNTERTAIYDYTGRSKGTTAAVLARILGVPEQDIVVEPDPNRSVDFRVVLGYNWDTCTYR